MDKVYLWIAIITGSLFVIGAIIDIVCRVWTSRTIVLNGAKLCRLRRWRDNGRLLMVLSIAAAILAVTASTIQYEGLRRWTR